MVQINAERIILREFEETDLGPVHEYARDEEVTAFLEWGPNNEEETRTFLSESITFQYLVPRANYDLAMVHIQDEKLIGGCGIVVVDAPEREALIGYVLNRSYWGHGYASEAARAIVGFGFSTLEMLSIGATCDFENVASQRVLEKVGMKRLEHLTGDREIKGQLRDTLVYQIRRSDWQIRS